MPLVTNDTLPFAGGAMMPIAKDTSATNAYNTEEFSKNYNYRLKGLHAFCQNLSIFGVKPTTTYKVPLQEFIDNFDFANNAYIIQSKISTAISNIRMKSQWEDFFLDIPNIVNSYALLEKMFGFEVEQRIIREEDKFISEHSLKEPLDIAYELVSTFFDDIETKTALYTDPEEPQCKFLNISIFPRNVKEKDINVLLDRFDQLQDNFLSLVDNKFASKITFHLSVR